MKNFYYLLIALFCSATVFSENFLFNTGLLSQPHLQRVVVMEDHRPSTQKNHSCGLCTIERGKWAIAPKFGIAPTWYANRGHNVFIFSDGSHSKKKLPLFDDMFDLPLMYGGHIGYMVRKHVELFVDVDYTHASGDSVHFHRRGNHYRQRFNDYNAAGAYVGMQFYAAFYKQRFTPFIGVKVGYLHRWKVKIHETIDDAFRRSAAFFHADNTSCRKFRGRF